MGGGPSQPAQISNEENERIHAEFQANLEREERQRAEAAAASRKAEEDRIAQLEEKRRRDEEEAARIKANRPFQKPIPPRLALTPRSNGSVNNMTITIAPGLSSSTVILSRDIIGKGSEYYPEPMDISPGKYAGTFWEGYYIQNFLVPEDPNFRIQPLQDGDKTTYQFTSAFPNKNFPEVWVKGRQPQTLTKSEYQIVLISQDTEMRSNRFDKFTKPRPLSEQNVIMWNPSETKGENGAVAINYRTHGALTKVFLKPTIPFEIGYALLPLIAPRPPASK
jgi:hypothetical protein